MAAHTVQFIVYFDDSKKRRNLCWPGTKEKLPIPSCEFCHREPPEVKRFLILEGVSLCAECVELDLKRMRETEERSERQRGIEK